MMYFSGDYTEKDMEVLAMNSPAIKEALDFEKEFNQDRESLRKYELREKAVKDYYSFLSAERELGEKRGHEKGKIEGRKEGIEIGKEEKAISIAKAALKKGLDFETVAAITGLSLNQVKNL